MQLNFTDFDPAYEQETLSIPSARKRSPMSHSLEDTDLPDELPEGKSPGAFKTISEAATLLNVPQHVLRFWESRFSQIKPLKLRGGRRYYRPEDIEILTTVKHLLYQQGYTIEGAKKAFNDNKKEDSKTPTPKAVLTDRQHSQLSVIRQELVGLKGILKPYIG